MRMFWKAVLAGFLVLALAAPAALAQKKNESEKMPPYDLEKEVEIKGVVEKVSDYHCPASGGMGAHLTLKKSGGELLEVHLALTRFLPEYEITFEVGQEIKVTGSVVTYKDAPAMLARKIERGNDQFFFRDKKGRPLW